MGQRLSVCLCKEADYGGDGEEADEEAEEAEAPVIPESGFLAAGGYRCSAGRIVAVIGIMDEGCLARVFAILFQWSIVTEEFLTFGPRRRWCRCTLVTLRELCVCRPTTQPLRGHIVGHSIKGGNNMRDEKHILRK